MRLKRALALGICAFVLGVFPDAKAQVVTATPDSIVVVTPDTVQQKETRKKFAEWSRPAKAAFYSGVLPGLGQAYNKSYWKIPLVYATGAVIGYFIYDNNKNYQEFSQALNLRTDGDPSTVDTYVNSTIYGASLPNQQGTQNLKRSRDFYRKYRDLDILLGLLAYGLNIMEAHVDAHLKAFDVSDDLSLQFKPNIVPMATTNQYSPALTLQINLK